MLPWWALPVTLALTALVSRPPGPVTAQASRLTRSAGVACVAIFAGLITIKSVQDGTVGADPVGTLRSLTEALVVLSLIMAPSARTSRDHRVWLTVTTGVLVAAAAGSHTATSAGLNIATWVILLSAIAKGQTTAAYADGAVTAVVVSGSRPASRLPSLWRSDSLIPVLGSLVAGTAVFFALPTGLGGGDLARRIATSVNGGPFVASRDEVGVDTFGSGDLSLLVRGALPDTPLLRVPASAPQLWRGTVYREYTGTSWDDGFSNTIVPLNGPSANVPAAAGDPPSAGHSETDRVRVEPGTRINLLWAPGVITHVNGRRGEIERVIRGANNVRAFGLFDRPITSYHVTSIVAPTKPAVLRTTGGTDPHNPVWTKLPATLPSEVVALARRITANATTRFQKVTDLEIYLHGHETYSQNSPVPAAGEDAVDDFLFRDHIGFCEQFATSEAVMLRALGIPARVITGLAGGVRTGNTRLLTASDAHAWVEVFYPGIGWSPTDPTAGVALATDVGGHRSLLSRTVDAVASVIPGGRLAMGALAAALLLMIRWLLGGARPGQRKSRRRIGDPNGGPILTAFLRLTRHPRTPASRADDETAREYLDRVGALEQVPDAVSALEQEMYGATPPDQRSTDAAVTAFGELTESRS
jgi:transglutaminase-like putative cysteine protease